MRINRMITALCALNLALVFLAGYLWILYEQVKNKKKVEVQTKYITNVVRRVVVKNTENTDTNPPVLFRRWRDLESTDYRIYIRNLRGFGCPEDVIQDIIFADVARLYDEKRKEFLARNPPKYWKGYDKEVYNGYKKLADEQKSLLKELLNVNYESYIAKLNIPESPSPPGLYLEFLSEDKRQKILMLLASKKELTLMIPPKSNSRLEENMEFVSFLIEKELGNLLTPEELKEFNIRNSPVARRLRAELTDIEISEEEYRQIYELAEKLDKEMVVNSDASDAHTERLTKLYEDYGTRLKQILGEKRYAEYLKYNDIDYRYISEFSRTYDIPKETTEKVYEFKKAFLSEIRRIENDSTLTFQQRSNIAVALMQESEKTLKSLLGDKIYNEYIQYDWDYESLFNSLLVENTVTNTQPQLQNTNETMTVPLPPWGPYPPPPPPLLRR